MASDGKDLLELKPISLNQVSPMTQRRQRETSNDDVDSTDPVLIVPTEPVQPAYNRDETIWHTGKSDAVMERQPGERPGPVTMVTGKNPAPVVCFNCRRSVMTYIYHQAGTCTYVTCFCIGIIGCDLGCCLIPFFIDGCKDMVHKCPECHVILGKEKRI